MEDAFDVDVVVEVPKRNGDEVDATWVVSDDRCGCGGGAWNNEESVLGAIGPDRLRCNAPSSQCNNKKVLTNHTGNSLAEATALGNRDDVDDDTVWLCFFE